MSVKKLILSVIREPKIVFAKIAYMFFSFFGHRNFKHFIILSTDRSGSNLLLQFLNSHPNIRADWEIFSNLSGRKEEKILAKTFSKQPFYIKAKGFKIFYMQPMDDDTGKVWGILKSMENLHVIHLKRRNILKREVSSKLAFYTGVWRVKPGDNRPEALAPQKTLHYPAAELKERFKLTKQWETTADDRFKHHPKITIFYEDLITDPDNVFRQITDFLDVEYRPPKSNLKKQGTRSMKDVVTNYNELKEAFKGTEWEPLFDD